MTIPCNQSLCMMTNIEELYKDAIFQVIDRQTGRIVGTYKNRNRARTQVDKLDNAYGAYRYSVRTIFADSNKGVTV